MLNLFDIVSTFLREETFLLLFDIANLNFDTILLFYYCLGIMLVTKYLVGIVWPPKKVLPRIFRDWKEHMTGKPLRTSNCA